MQIPSTTTPIRPMVYVSHYDHGQREERKTPSQYHLFHPSPAISRQPSTSRQFQAKGPGWEMDLRPSNDLQLPITGGGNRVATVLSHKTPTIRGSEPNWITREDRGPISGGSISHGFSKINSEIGTRVEDSNQTSVCPTPNQSHLFPPPPPHTRSRPRIPQAASLSPRHMHASCTAACCGFPPYILVQCEGG
jgi:hypothetical protein